MTGPFDLDPELADALGRATNAWSHVEYNLTMLFALLAALDFHTAAAIFDFFKSTTTQSDVLLRLAKINPNASAVLEQIRAMLKEYKALAARRNEVSHNPFGVRENKLYVMIKTKGRPGSLGIPYETKTITTAEIKKLREDIQNFTTKILLINVGLGYPKLLPKPSR